MRLASDGSIQLDHDGTILSSEVGAAPPDAWSYITITVTNKLSGKTISLEDRSLFNLGKRKQHTISGATVNIEIPVHGGAMRSSILSATGSPLSNAF